MSWGQPITPENISPVTLLMMLGALGFTLKPAGPDGLLVQPRNQLTPELTTAIRRCKGELLELVGASA